MNFNIIEKKYGKILVSDEDNLVENYIRTNEEIWDKEVVMELEKYINSESIIVDVGAYIGEMIVYLSKKCKHVHAFEPQLRRFQQMCANFYINECYNVTSYNMGACEKEKNIQINHPCGTNHADGRLSDGGITKCITLDSLNLAPNIIKIDAQGYDYFVIEGSRETILKHKPIIIFEYENFSSKSLDECKSLLNSLNYDVALIKENIPDYVAKPK